MSTILLVIVNEIRKVLLIAWDYRFSTLMELMLLGLVFTGALLFTGEGEFLPEQSSSALIGLILTVYVIGIINRMSWAMMSEAQSGTLEQMYMSPVASGWILIGRTLTAFLIATIFLLILAPALILIFAIPITLPPAVWPVFLLTLLGVSGFGFMIAGMTLVFKQVGPLANLLSRLLLFMNGTFLPVENLPDEVAVAARILPGAQGIVALRQVALDGVSLSALWTEGALVFLMAHSFLSLALGWFIFRRCETIARQHGSLGHY